MDETLMAPDSIRQNGQSLFQIRCKGNTKNPKYQISGTPEIQKWTFQLYCKCNACIMSESDCIFFAEPSSFVGDM